jgi:TonB family protein
MMPLILEAALRSAALALAAWLLLKVLRIRDVRAEKLLWTLMIASSLAMPVLMRLIALPPTVHTLVTIPGSSVAAGILNFSRKSTLASALFNIYLSVTGLLLLRFLVRLARAYRLYHRAQRHSADNFSLDVHISDEIRAPCTFASSILVPTEFVSWSPAARRAALAHEQAHVIHLDCYRLWLATLYCCAFWFNPVAWLVRRRLVLLAELTSDREALRCIENSTIYAKILVQLAANAPPLEAAVAMSGRTHLAERINYILETNMISHRVSTARMVALTGASLTAAVLCISCASGPHVLSQAEDPKVSWVSGAPLGQFYPAELRQQRIEGDVVLKLTVDRAGQVTDAAVVTERPEGAGLGVAAVHAAQTFRFNNRLAEPVIKTINVKFKLVD